MFLDFIRFSVTENMPQSFIGFIFEIYNEIQNKNNKKYVDHKSELCHRGLVT